MTPLLKNCGSETESVATSTPASTQNLNYTPRITGGMIGIANNMTSKLYSPPISGVEYIASSVQEFVGGKPAYAQGTGFTGLQAILPIWKAFRNIVYIFSSLILIIIGLMVMLRIKISPQAVVTIQSALPQLVITLLLVTFSYAIAGLLIDLSYFIQAVVLAILFDAQGRSLTQNLIQDPNIVAGMPFTFNNLSGASITTIFSTAGALVPTGALIVLGAIAGAIIDAIAGTHTAIVGAALGAVIGGSLLTLVFGILILFWIIKLFFGLIKCYVTLILKIIIAPLEIGMGAFPSAKMGFNTWVTDVIANLAVFPITLLFMVIANVLVEKARGGLWAPNLLSGSTILAGVNNMAGGIVPRCYRPWCFNVNGQITRTNSSSHLLSQTLCLGISYWSIY